MMQSYVNPYRQLYLWGSSEALELRSLLEAIELVQTLEERRRKLMKNVSLTEDQCISLRPPPLEDASFELKKP